MTEKKYRITIVFKEDANPDYILGFMFGQFKDLINIDESWFEEDKNDS